MKFSIGEATRLSCERVRCHVFERAVHLVEMLNCSSRSGKPRGFGLHYLAQFEQISEQFIARIELEQPQQHIRVQQLPRLEWSYLSTDPGPGVQQAFGDEDSDCLPVYRSR